MSHAPGIAGLVLSRFRYDAGRHLAAMLAITILLASVIVFHAVAAGLGAGVSDLVAEERPNELAYTQNALFSSTPPVSEAQLNEVRSWPGVVEATGRRVAPSGIDRENTTGAILVAGIDFAAERARVASVDPPPPPQFGFLTISFGSRMADNYSLFEGRWPTNEGEAVITASLRAPGWGVGERVVFETPRGERSVTIVGIILDDHPAGHAVPGTTTAGHLLVADHLLVGTGFRSIRVVTTTEYDAVRGVADRMRDLWPESWRENKAQVEAFEKRHYEAVRAQAVLGAAGRFVLLSGAATVFAMSLMLLNGERRSLGVFLALGLGARRMMRYILVKMTLIIAGGILAGVALGRLLVAYVPMPDLGYALVPQASEAEVVRAVLSTLLAAAIGGVAAVYLALRESPATGLRMHE